MICRLRRVQVSGLRYSLVISSPSLIRVLALISTLWSDITLDLVLFLKGKTGQPALH